MYYTPVGGDIMFVEAAIRRLFGYGSARRDDEKTQVSGWGNVSLILTGQLGDVMKESARAALTYAATHASNARRFRRTGSARSRCTSTCRRARFRRTVRRPA